VPSRAEALKAFRRFADTGSRTRFEALNAALADCSSSSEPEFESGSSSLKPQTSNLKPQTSTFRLQPVFGVMWRTARTAAGEDVAFVTNLSKSPATVRIPGTWREVRDGRAVSGAVTLQPLDLLILKH